MNPENYSDLEDTVEYSDTGLILGLLIALAGWASIALAVWSMWNYMRRYRWGRPIAITVICLIMIPLIFGGWVLFDVLWLAWWLSKKARTAAARARGS